MQTGGVVPLDVEARRAAGGFGAGFGGSNLVVGGPLQDYGGSSKSNALTALHEMEHLQMEMLKQKAIHDAEAQAITRAQQRMQAMFSANVTASGSGTSSELSQLIADMKVLEKRVTDIEKLIIIHDNAIKNHENTLKSIPPAPPIPQPLPKPGS